jgi:hypothetical protein
MLLLLLKYYVVLRVYQVPVITFFLEKKNYFFLAEEVALVKTTAPEAVSIELSYKGPHIELPINKMHFESLIVAFQRGEVKYS